MSTLLGAQAHAQGGYFYHTTGSETIAMNLASNKFLLEFTDTATAPDTFNAKHIYQDTYEVTDTSDLDTLTATHKIHPVYSDGDDNYLYVCSYIFIKFKEEISATEKAGIVSNNNLQLVDSIEIYERYRITSNANTLTLANSIFNTGMVDICYPDFISTMLPGTSDTYYGKQYYLKNTGQVINDGKTGTPGADIKIEGAWAYNKGSSSMIVGVIDKGLTSNHPDLPNTRQVRLNGSNFSPYISGNNNRNDPSPENLSFSGWNHGNACAGIIAATHDNEGIAGICPNCKILPVRIDLGAPMVESNFVNAINFTADNGAKIINCSWGVQSTIVTLPLIKAAIENQIRKGHFFALISQNYAVHSAGNSGYVPAPADKDIPGAIVVGASNRYDQQADYSPTSEWVEIVATSSHTGAFSSTSEAEDVWTIDIPGSQGQNPFFDFSASSSTLPPLNEILPSTGQNNDAYTGRFSGSSAAAPMVAGVAALMLTENNCLSPAQIEDILESTADKVGGYKYSIYNSKGYYQGRSKEMGYGRLNAKRAVEEAHNAKKTTLDLYMKDDITDVGTGRTYNTDFSPDIWIRNQNDGRINQHYERPLYNPGFPVYVYIRIRNKSCVDFVKTNNPNNYGKLEVFWSKAATFSSYPNNWNGSNPSIGNAITTNTPIPSIPAGGEAIIEIPWYMPSIFNNGDLQWRVCILAQINVAGLDERPSYGSNFPMYVGASNNVTLLNTWVTKANRSSGGGGVLPNNGSRVYFPIGGKIRLGNPETTTAAAYNFKFEVPPYTKPNLTDYAEVKLIFDNAGWQIFQNSHAFDDVEGVKVLGNGVVALTKPSVTLSNISFPADSFVEVYLGFQHWSDSVVSDTTWYDYRITQSVDSIPDTTLGTCNFQLVVDPRNPFSANAGTDRQINKGQSVTLSATDIGEPALYLWYDKDGNIIDSVQNPEFDPDTTTTYKLQVIASSDDFTDYDEVTVNVRQYFITSISPNPASTSVTVQYDIANATNASLVLTPINPGPSYTYLLNTSQTSITINTSGYMLGNYIVTLVCNGNNADSKSLLIN